MLSVSSLIFDAGGSVCWSMFVYMQAHTHTADGVLDVSPGIGKRHLQGPKNPARLNLGTYSFVYVYTVHTCK